MRELVEFVSVALARSVASALLWNTDHRRPCLPTPAGGFGPPGEVNAAVSVKGGAFFPYAPKGASGSLSMSPPKPCCRATPLTHFSAPL